jgi:hypothetical protein
MRDLSQDKVWSYSDETPNGGWGKCQVRKHAGTLVNSYKDLAVKVASIQFHNPNLVLFFRGQEADFRIDNSPQKNSTIRPSIFRRDESYGIDNWNAEIRRRYQELAQAETRLVEFWKKEVRDDPAGLRRLERSSVIRWAILQHYEVCDTPLLDVTLSLRISASFASLNNASGEAFVMVLAAPQISGAVSACAHNEMQILRLSSLCPPSAIRPHIQEGYLLGEYPELRTFEEKTNLALHETDFGQRLIAKFRFNPATFWNDPDFPLFSPEALSLSEGDDGDKLRLLAKRG